MIDASHGNSQKKFKQQISVIDSISIENNNNYYNVEDEINFEKLKNFRKFNSNVKHH